MVETNPPEPLQGDVTSVLTKTKFGTLFQKDTWDLFSSLMLSLKLATHGKRMGLQKYRDSFQGREAVQNLTSFKFLRSPDTRDLSNLVPMSTLMAKLPEQSALSLMQQFIDGSLIKESKDVTTEKETVAFNKKGIYTPTFKGLRILEEFIQVCNLESDMDHLVAVLSTLPMPRPKLIRVSRNASDDELVVTQPVISHLFRQLVGRFPNYISRRFKDHGGVLLTRKEQTSDILKGLFKQDARPLEGKIPGANATHCISAPRIIQWLRDNTVVSSSYEAVEVAAQFVRFGFIVLVAVRAKQAQVTKFTATGPVPRGNTSVTATGEFVYSQRALYAITIEGSSVAGWPGTQNSRMDFIPDFIMAPAIAQQGSSSPATEEPLKEEPIDPANAARLRRFIKSPAFLSLFREFLSEGRCEHDLAFWIDVEDFKAEFEQAYKATTPVLPDLPPVEGSSTMPLDPLPPPERPHEVLGNRPFLIYNMYFVPSSTCQLSFNIGKDLQEELKGSLENCVEYLTNKIFTTEADDVGGGDSTTLGIDQLAIIVWLYERIQNRVFCAMADEQVSKFLKWPKFLAARIDSLTSPAEEPDTNPILVNKGKNKEESN